MPSGGRGYVRPPSLVSLWSTAPFLADNSIGSFTSNPSVDARMKSFNDAITKLLWPERRDKDLILGNKVPGVMDRTTEASYLRIPVAYLPDSLKPTTFWSRNFPMLFSEKDFEISSIPLGTPIGLFANLNLLSESSNFTERLQQQTEVLKVLSEVRKSLGQLPSGATNEQRTQALVPLVQSLFNLSKCPDLVVGRGHYFGTALDQGGTNLSDDDKRALIEFLKTL
jgi:hypothetical protein